MIQETVVGLHKQYFVAVPSVSTLEISSYPHVIWSTTLTSLSQLLFLFAFTFVTSFVASDVWFMLRAYLMELLI